MSAPDSVTNWLAQLRAGDSAAAQPLWERYFRRLLALARKRLRGVRLREADEEDVVLSAFDSFCKGAVQDRFPQLADRDNLWRLLVVITARKAQDLMKKQKALRVGGGRVRGDSVWLDLADPMSGGIEEVVGDEPTPEFVAEVAEQCQRLLDKLPDDELRQIAVWKMEGNTNDEIAERHNLAVSTVERRLRLIRKLWDGERSSEHR
jgi:DNA-directed RNA polymerase specialized sigma24 family protein